MQVEQSDPASNSSIVTIHLFAVSKKFRNQGVCTKTVASMIESMPAGTIVIVYCTKYARVMQQILLKLRFKRDKARRDNLAKFIYQKI